MRDLVLIVGDTHTNSTLGLCPPTVPLDDGGIYNVSTAQRWLWDCWADLQQHIAKARKRRDRLTVIVAGDAVDRNIHTAVELISRNDATIVRMGAAVFRGLREAANNFFVVRGTEAHVAPAGWLEEALARELDATPWPKDNPIRSIWHLRANIGGIGFDVAHHVSCGLREWTKANSLGTVAVEVLLQYAAVHELAPQYVIRAHRHQYVDSGNNYPTRVIICPAWQLLTGYAHKVCTNRLADIGALLFVIDDGRAQCEVIRYQPGRDAAWALS